MWAQELKSLLARQPCVLVTVASVAGSAPRAMGTRMLVTADEFRGSIGGGNLEHQAIASAREMLARSGSEQQKLGLYGLGPELNQCCGGAVTLLFEAYIDGCPAWLDAFLAARTDHSATRLVSAIDTGQQVKWLVDSLRPFPHDLPGAVGQALQSEGAGEGRAVQLVDTGSGRFLVEPVSRNRLPLFLFGAGHVGTSLVEALRDLPFDITWLDSRPGQFMAPERAHLDMRVCADPPAAVADCPPGGTYVVVTHSHALDEDICFNVLQRGDAKWLGLIGSATKRRRFVHRLAGRGIPADDLEGLICPIGLDGITGKRPATIAIAVAAQLLLEVVPEAWR